MDRKDLLLLTGVFIPINYLVRSMYLRRSLAPGANTNDGNGPGVGEGLKNDALFTSYFHLARVRVRGGAHSLTVAPCYCTRMHLVYEKGVASCPTRTAKVHRPGYCKPQ